MTRMLAGCERGRALFAGGRHVVASALFVLAISSVHAQTTVVSGEAGPKASDGQYVYWLTFGDEFCNTPGAIKRAPITGTGPVQTIYQGICIHSSGKIVVSGADLYARFEDNIVKVPATGGAATWTLSAPGIQTDLIVRDGLLWWLDDQGIKYATTSGTGVTVLTAPAFPNIIADGIAVDANYLYFVLLNVDLPNTFNIRRNLRNCVVPGPCSLFNISLGSGQVNYLNAPRIVGVDSTLLYLKTFQASQESILSIMSTGGGFPTTIWTTSGTYFSSFVVKEDLGVIWTENFRSPTSQCGGPGDFCGTSTVQSWRKPDGVTQRLALHTQQSLYDLAYDATFVYYDTIGCHASHCDGDYADIVQTHITNSFVDSDRDGFAQFRDCADNDASVYPGAPQLCDGKNNDCNAPGWPTVPANEADVDLDGVRICAGDCNDSDAAVRPGAPQLCDGKNNDCNAAGWPTVSASELDADLDHYVTCQPWVGSVAGILGGGDCDDANPAITNCNTPTSSSPTTVPSDDGNDSITFSSVTSPGDTTLAQVSCPSGTGPDSDVPSFFALPGNPVCENIQTTATFPPPAEVCMTYTDTGNTSLEQGYRMLAHHDHLLCTDTCASCITNTDCANSTCAQDEILPNAVPVDTVNNIVCSNTTCLSRFSPGSLVDSDVDGVYDVFDNCPSVSNFFQTNGDGDRAGDVCDCRPSDAALWLVPGEARVLLLARGSGMHSDLSWLPPLDYGGTAAPLYDVLRSPTPTSFSSATCLAKNLVLRTTTDPDTPSPGQVFYYVARGKDVCGSGSLGKKSNGATRVGRTCN